MTIHTLGDRRHSGFCLMCGTDLMIPWNDYQCCTECTKFIQECQTITRMSKDKRSRKKILNSRDIMRQAGPIGGIPE